MALVTLQHPVSTLSGKVTGESGNQPNGLVYYPIEGRQIARSHFIPANPESVYQTNVRAHLAAAADAYQALNQNEVTAWKALAAQIEKTGRLDLKYNLTSIGCYCAVNCARQLAGAVITDTAPALVRPVPKPVTGATWDSVGQALTISSGSGQWPAGKYLVRMTDVIPGTARVARRNELRVATVLAINAWVEVDPAAEKVSFLEIPAANMRFPSAITGARVGIEITSYSLDWCPGYRTFNPNVTITAA